METNCVSKLSQMTEREKQAFVDGIELCCDCGDVMYLPAEDIEMYEEIIKERAAAIQQDSAKCLY